MVEGDGIGTDGGYRVELETASGRREYDWLQRKYEPKESFQRCDRVHEALNRCIQEPGDVRSLSY